MHSWTPTVQSDKEALNRIWNVTYKVDVLTDAPSDDSPNGTELLNKDKAGTYCSIIARPLKVALK